jgi:hypothetical protein
VGEHAVTDDGENSGSGPGRGGGHGVGADGASNSSSNNELHRSDARNMEPGAQAVPCLASSRVHLATAAAARAAAADSNDDICEFSSDEDSPARKVPRPQKATLRDDSKLNLKGAIKKGRVHLV